MFAGCGLQFLGLLTTGLLVWLEGVLARRLFGSTRRSCYFVTGGPPCSGGSQPGAKTAGPGRGRVRIAALLGVTGEGRGGSLHLIMRLEGVLC